MTPQEKIILEQIKVEWPDWKTLDEKFIQEEIKSRVWWLDHFDRIPFTNLRCHTCKTRIISGDFANICGNCYAVSRK